MDKETEENKVQSTELNDQPSVPVAEAGEQGEAESTVDQVEAIEAGERTALVEALLFASPEPLAVVRLAEICKATEDEIEVAVQELVTRYAQTGSGFEISKVADKYQLRTRVLFAPYVRVMRAGRPKRLSNAALETLAIIAYRQPVVKSDIEKIRGVDVTPTLKTLLERNLVRIMGHQPSVGQPALYGTTEEFLKLFGLSSLGELPTLRDIKELERDPGETGQDDDDAGDEASNSAVMDQDGRSGGVAAAG
jgi:segregation and condensation protein B